MTKTGGKTASSAVKDILLSSLDGLRDAIRAIMQEVLEAERDEPRRLEGGTHARASWLSLRLLRPHAGDPRGQA